jgi:hypothetical protein
MEEIKKDKFTSHSHTFVCEVCRSEWLKPERATACELNCIKTASNTFEVIVRTYDQQQQNTKNLIIVTSKVIANTYPLSFKAYKKHDL